MDPAALSAREMEVLEANALALGRSLDSLMENAGRAVAEETARRLPPPARLAILAGTGNNGGDGTCAAFYLAQWGYAPEVWIVRPPSEIRSGAARRCFERIAHRLPVHVGVPAAADLAPFAVVLDALLGTGQTGPVRPPYSEAVRALADSGVPVLSVDVPSGLGSPGAVRPRWTVTLTCPKLGMDPGSSGEIVVRDIGIPEVAGSETGPGEYRLFPIAEGRARSARILVIGGGPFAGAPALTALAALRAGAERATVLCPATVAGPVPSFSPDLVVRAVGEGAFRVADADPLAELLRETKHHAIALGMGAGRDPETVACFTRVLRGLPPGMPCVVDADALEAALEAFDGTVPRPVVLTPNEGELRRIARLTGAPTEEERLSAAQRLAKAHGLTVLAKGDPDLIVDAAHRQRNRHHHPAALVSGVGGVRSGVVAAVLGAGAEPRFAALLGSFWVGDAGVRGHEGRGYGLTASDVLDELPGALVEGQHRLRG